MIAKSYKREREREREQESKKDKKKKNLLPKKIKIKKIVKNTVESIQPPCFYFQCFITADKIYNLFFSTFIGLMI